MKQKPRTVALLSREMQHRCFSREAISRLEEITDFHPATVDQCTAAHQLDAIRDAEIVITGWDTAPFTEEMLDAAPGLRLLCYAGGSVRHLFDTQWLAARRIRLCTVRAANATSVAEFAFAMMLVSMKSVWQFRTAAAHGAWRPDDILAWVREPYQSVVGIVGASCVGREMIRFCRTLELRAILVHDPYLSEEEAAALGVEKTGLDELMRRADVVTLHTPAIEACRHLINGKNLALMKDRAIFINTARGLCVDEKALIAELEKGRLFACLDVTDPEPPVPDSPLYSLPNCILTPHVAGSLKENVLRHGDWVLRQVEAYVSGTQPPGELDPTVHHLMA